MNQIESYLLWALTLYGALLTAITFRHKQRQRIAEQRLSGGLLSHLNALDAAQPGPSLERLKALAEIMKIERDRLPWHERFISTLTAVAFVSLLIATGVQAISTQVERAEVERLQHGVSSLEAVLKEADAVISDAAAAILTDAQEPTPSGERVLRHRLNALRRARPATDEGLRSQYEIAMRLGEFWEATEIFRREARLQRGMSPSDLLMQAEHYYLIGLSSPAQQILHDHEKDFISLPQSGRVRALVLRAAVDGSSDPLLAELSLLWGVTYADAVLILDRRMRQLKRSIRL